ncbi:conserved hypothetical protein [Flavobacterium sp. 9AF]|uniref:hypothetical protein n=1 Tax=Flavobacterium sp. 9AF TaxID=2653142 RepID=UPI0012F413B9|nr:hypothetical protein [Flavobacterium sp. 9AF]VXB08513.1 conserved hypothetical protein [Flavobacterium sp. 9AF]
MNSLNQNTFMTSLKEALVPSSTLIDGRTERDWLGFIADFASLINFYDSYNQINGNWSPFILKDPIVILATISRTNVSKKQTVFLQTCSHINILYEKDQNDQNIGSLIVSLLDQIFKLFLKLERWIHFLLQSNQEFSLKEYIIYQVENIYSAQLWALLSLRKQLILHKIIVTSEAFEWSVFQKANPQIWKQNKDKKTFWEVLHLDATFLKNKIPDFIRVIKQSGEELFTFFTSLTHYAKIAFHKLKETKSNFPDTVLMRTFINLLMNHCKEINEISKKHLNFYYSDILKQQLKKAQPDQVFASIQLAKKNAAFLLPKNTLFTAGIDTENNPIYFSSNEEVSLNPASVLRAKTIFTSTLNEGNTAFLQEIASPSTLQKDESGKIMGWPIFGGNISPLATTVDFGFALASPLLLLKEGGRNIQLTLFFNEPNAIIFLNNAHFYLSTQENWFAISPSITEDSNNTTSVILNISLDNKQPAIEAFSINPDGYTCEWPLLKIVFTSFPSGNIPILNALQWDITVNNVASLQLANDFGALDPKKPFELFGPTPVINSNFIIGSSEIFSKPLQTLEINLNWDTLPDSFQNYYLEYNKYISATTQNTKKSKSIFPNQKSHGLLQKLENIIKGGLNIVKSAFQKIVDSIIALLKEIVQLLKDLLGILEPDPTIPFNNVCFTVDFEILNNSSWSSFHMIKEGVAIALDGSITPIPYVPNPYCVPEADTTANLLFSTNDSTKECLLTENSFFRYTSPSGNENKTMFDPSIQNTPFVYSDESRSGFIKMSLTGPNPYGFGSQIYPEVVSNIALQNALLISKDPKTNPKKLATAAKLPYSPKLKKITANYTVSEYYDVTQTGNYPLQCFAYTPFTTYSTYNNNGDLPLYNFNVGENHLDPMPNNGIPLLSSFYNYKGFLYIELKDVLAPNIMNLYVELGRKEGTIPTNTKPDYYYLSTNGWKLLPVLSDGTNNLSCSGIITFNIPKDCSNKTNIMSSQNFWICLATKSAVSNYPDITFLQTNGILLSRSGTTFLSASTAPKINANVITKPKSSIPEIESVSQPFPSFGGKPMETESIKNIRVSNRLKTKDRIASTTDYYRMIQEEFPEIFFSKSIYNNKKAQIYVVKKCDNANDYNAFTPMISVCKEEKIQKYLSERVSAFTSINVANFSFLSVTVNATITLFDGYEFQGVEKEIQTGLSLFLSPWITTNNLQIIIDEPLSNIDVINYIKTISGVSNVSELYFTTSRIDANGTTVTTDNVTEISLVQNPELLIASSTNHRINERE